MNTEGNRVEQEEDDYALDIISYQSLEFSVLVALDNGALEPQKIAVQQIAEWDDSLSWS